MKKQLKKFNVIQYDHPGKVKRYDVLPYFRERWKEKGKFAKDERAKVVDRATLRSWIIARSQYQFWGRCEYEHCLATWPIGSKRVNDKLKTILTPDFNLDDYSQSIDFYNAILMDMEKIDIHDQIMMNIDIITDILYDDFLKEEHCNKEEIMEEKDKAKAPDLKGEDYSGKRFGYKIPNGYEFDMICNGKIILKPIEPKYPKTFEECLNMLYCKSVLRTILGHKAVLLFNLEMLLICRDAYWKIAGEEMGLGKPWEPNYETLVDNTFFTIQTFNGEIDKSATSHRNAILAFPNIEMRDAFYENFKYLIDACKELL